MQAKSGENHGLVACRFIALARAVMLPHRAGLVRDAGS
jgi:hypothetical protein